MSRKRSELRIVGGTKSSTSGWVKSSFCTSGTCVEITLNNNEVIVADSKDKNENRPVITVEADQWNSFLDGLNLAADTANTNLLSVEADIYGITQLSDGKNLVSFENGEWQDFLSEVAEGNLRAELVRP